MTRRTQSKGKKEAPGRETTATFVGEGTILYKLDERATRTGSALSSRTTCQRFTQHTGLDAGMQPGDTVMIEYAGDLCNYDWNSIATCPGGTHQASTTPDDLATLYERAIDRLRAMGCVPVVLTLPPLHPQLFFSYATRGIDSQNILRWVGGDISLASDLHKQYNDTLKAVADRKAVHLIDISHLFDSTDPATTLYSPDGLHPSAEGEMAIEATVREFRF